MSEAEATNGCLKAFGAHDFGPQELEEYTRLIDSTKPYILFVTPLSGSSYLAELLSKTDRLGQPEEFLNQDLAPLSLKHIAETGCEIKHVIDYLTWLIRNRSSDNGVFGLKVSYGCHRLRNVPAVERIRDEMGRRIGGGERLRDDEVGRREPDENEHGDLRRPTAEHPLDHAD